MTGSQFPNILEKKPISPIAILSLGFSILIGGVIRFVHIFPYNFPLNDGGFFFQMILDLQEVDYALPLTTTYNLKQIPFAYPPLAFYVGGFLSNLFDGSVIGILRFLPATISILTIPAFFLLSRRLLSSDRQVILATAGFAFLPTAFDWLIVGGGLTRSFGYLFGILALWQVCALFQSNENKHIILTILFASLTILSHPGSAWFALYCSVIILAFNFKDILSVLKKSLWVIFSVLILTSPWWFTVVTRHGLAVLTYPFQTETSSLASFLTPFTFLFTNEPLLDILAFSGFIGVIICIYNRLFLFPVWLFSIFIFEARLGTTYSVVPMALLIGVGIDQAVLPIVVPSREQGKNKFHGFVSKFVGGYLIIYVIINAYLGINYQVVSQNEIRSMKWINANTPSSSQFLILSGIPQYGIDPISEWFPALSQRSSLTTPQGHEWLPGEEFNRRVGLHEELQETYLECAEPRLLCVLAWAELREVNFSHVYIPSSVPYQASIDSISEFSILQDGPGGLILARK